MTTTGYDYASNRVIPLGSARIRMLDSTGPRSLVKIYCACGKIVDLDKKEMSIKKLLKKDLECTSCRNMRVAKDIDLLNAHFDFGESSEEDAFC